MKNLFRLGLLLTLAGAAPLTFSSCSTSKREEPVPTSTTGRLTGSTAPVGAISEVRATAAAGNFFAAKPDPTTGTFSLDRLTPGAYQLSFTVANGYEKPVPRPVTIVAGQTVDLGRIVALSDGIIKSGVMEWTVSGVSYRTTVVGGRVDTKTNRSFSATGSYVIGSQRERAGLSLVFNGRTGTYPFGSSNIGGYFQDSGNVTTGEFYTPDSGALGAATITAYDSEAGTLTGTFNFIAQEYTGIPGAPPSSRSIAVTNGTFSLYF